MHGKAFLCLWAVLPSVVDIALASHQESRGDPFHGSPATHTGAVLHCACPGQAPNLLGLGHFSDISTCGSSGPSLGAVLKSHQIRDTPAICHLAPPGFNRVPH